VIAALTLVLPLSLGGAISPMLLTEQTVLLGTGGRRAANRFALGAVVALLVIVTVVVFAGHLVELPTEPTLSRTLDVVLGVLLLAIGGATHYIGEHPLRRRKREGEDGEPRDRLSLVDHPNAAFPFGAVSMATNFTNLALVVVAAKGIATADLDRAERILLILVVVAISSLPVWLPLAATKMAPRTGQRALDTVHRLIIDHGRAAVVVLFGAAGFFLLARGIFGI